MGDPRRPETFGFSLLGDKGWNNHSGAGEQLVHWAAIVFEVSGPAFFVYLFYPCFLRVPNTDLAVRCHEGLRSENQVAQEVQNLPSWKSKTN